MNQHDRLGPYRLLRRLGEGGMGVVHLALDPQGRQVAIKVLRAEVAGDDVARRRLSREVETMRRVRSAYIAEVVDADVTGSRPYIVTRYVAGMPLDDTVKEQGALSVTALLRVAHGVAEALATVHAAGVIHRDLKPGNVMLLDGDPVLIDFGIAQAVDATRLTQTGMFIGTPGYLAPEIIEGHEGGPEVDVHAWAGTMLYAATGLPPFGKGTLEMVFYNITAGKANVDAAPSVIRPLLRAAFQRDPAKRPTAAELAAQLSRLVPPRSTPGRVQVPDEILTLPDSHGTGASLPHPGPPQAGRPGASAIPGTGAASVPGTGPSAGRPQVPDPRPATPTPAAPAEEFVSLLGDAPDKPGSEGDPWPTVRVTGEDLRKVGMAPPTPAHPWRGVQPSHTAQPSQAGQASPGAQPAPFDQGEVPTRRVRSEDLNELAAQAWPPPRATPAPPEAKAVQTPPGRTTPGHPETGGAEPPQLRTTRVPPEVKASKAPSVRGMPPTPEAHGARPYHQALFEQAPDYFEQTPHLRQQSPGQYIPTMRMPPEGAAGHEYGGEDSPDVLRRSPVYVVASVLLMVIVIGVAVAVPVLTALLVVPAVVLLRAADIAQPALDGRAGSAAADVLRVLGRPGALLKSIGVTLALVPYALVPSVSVTVVLAFVVKFHAATALSWGVAVFLWIICAGPGVEGPGRQIGRTLASLFPSRSAATTVAWILAVVAVLAGAYAVSTLVSPIGEAVWTPVDINGWLERLKGLGLNITAG